MLAVSRVRVSATLTRDTASTTTALTTRATELATSTTIPQLEHTRLDPPQQDSSKHQLHGYVYYSIFLSYTFFLRQTAHGYVL